MLRMYSYLKTIVLCFVLIGFTACQDQAQQTRIGDEVFIFDYAITSEQKEQGLMFVEEMPNNYGMVFMNDVPSYSKYWMKNTLIPLDMLFFDETNTLVHIEHSATPHDLTPRGPDIPVCTIVEINGGQAKERNIELGQKLFINVAQECLQSPNE
jgi:uncharacterized membrane protein (UPF0127 family)